MDDCVGNAVGEPMRGLPRFVFDGRNLPVAYFASIFWAWIALNATMSSGASRQALAPGAGFRGLKVTGRKIVLRRVDSHFVEWKTDPASLRRGADLKSFPEGIS